MNLTNIETDKSKFNTIQLFVHNSHHNVTPFLLHYFSKLGINIETGIGGFTFNSTLDTVWSLLNLYRERLRREERQWCLQERVRRVWKRERERNILVHLELKSQRLEFHGEKNINWFLFLFCFKFLVELKFQRLVFQRILLN